MNKLGCMTDHWLFSRLSPGEKMHLQTITRKPTYEKGEMLFLEGDPSTSMFLLTGGRVKLFKVSETGKEVILAFLTPHDLFGEEVLFADSVHSMSAMAMEPTRLCVCAKRDIVDMVRKNPDFAMTVIETLGNKLNQVTGQFVNLAMHKVRDRVANVLVRLARESGENVPQGKYLNFRLTHEELAALVGASRVMVTNVLQELKKEDYISIDGNNHFVVGANLLKEGERDTAEVHVPEPPPCPCYQGTASA